MCAHGLTHRYKIFSPSFLILRQKRWGAYSVVCLVHDGEGSVSQPPRTPAGGGMSSTSTHDSAELVDFTHTMISAVPAGEGRVHDSFHEVCLEQGRYQPQVSILPGHPAPYLLSRDSGFYLCVSVSLAFSSHRLLHFQAQCI